MISKLLAPWKRTASLFCYLLLLGLLCLTPSYGQKSKANDKGTPPISEPYNFNRFKKTEKKHVELWKKWNDARYYSHPDFGILPQDAPCTNCIEVLEKRKANERYFIDATDSNVFYTQTALGTINHWHNGYWVAIHENLKPIGNDVYESMFIPEPAGFEVKEQRSYIKTPKGKQYFNVWSLWSRTNGVLKPLAKADWSEYSVGEEGMYIKNIFKGIDAEMIVYRGGIKTNFILKENAYGTYDDLVFIDDYSQNQSVRIDFTDTPGVRESVGKLTVTHHSNAVMEVSDAIIYPRGAGELGKQSAEYSITPTSMGIVVPSAWINRYIGQYELIIDPLVYGSNTLAQAAITGSMYNASCDFINSCNYNLDVSQPAASTITDIQYTFSYVATGICYKSDGAVRIGLNSCTSPQTAGYYWFCNQLSDGNCNANNISVFNDLQSCRPAPNCNAQNLAFQLRFYRSCYGNNGCSSGCISAISPFIINLTGRTLEMPTATSGGINVSATTVCQNQSLNVGTNGGQYGKPPYTYNWSFNASGTPSLSTLQNPTLTFPTVGTQTLYLTVKDNCNASITLSRDITVSALNTPSVTLTASPAGSVCEGTMLTFTASAVHGGTPSYVWRRNGSIVGTNATTYSSATLVAGDVITVTMTSSLGCVTSNTAVASYTVALHPPLLTPTVAVLPILTGACSVSLPIAPTAINSCTGAVVTATTTSPLLYTTQGTHTIVWEYSDAMGLTLTQPQTVVIADTAAPIPTIVSLPVLTEICSLTVTTFPTATDACAGLITATTTDPLVYTASGSYTIHWLYDDGNGNTVVQTQQVILDDTIAPVPNMATLPVLMEVCSLTVTTIPTATDNCGGTITATTSSPLTYTGNGTYTIQWEYKDASGNITIQPQVIILNDALAPVPDMAILPTIIEQCSYTITSFPTATDNCGGTITGTTIHPLVYTESGTYTVMWTYTDANNNTAVQVQQISIEDTLAPVPTLTNLPTITAACSATITAIPTATDNCDGLITGTTISPLTFTTQGTHTLVWFYTDASGNLASQSQLVIIEDTEAPVPTVATLATITAECSASIVAPTALDNCGGVITATTTDPLTYTQQGTYTITWTYTDAVGLSTTQTQEVVIENVSVPVPTVVNLPLLEAQCSLTITTIPTAEDTCGTVLLATTTAPLVYTAQGTYTITWTYTDAVGHSFTQTQMVVVEDTELPVPDAVTLPTLTDSCSVEVSSFPTATDACAGTLVGTTTDPLNYSIQGDYSITWTFDDGNGNLVQQIQLISVRDTQPPVVDVASLPTLTDACSVTVTTYPTATDNCGGTIIGTTSEALVYTNQGTYTITWLFDDGHGNIITQNQTVVVADTTAPVATVPTLVTHTGQCSVVITDAPTAMDNCLGLLTGTTTDALVYNQQGTYTVTWTYDDGHGNVLTQPQLVVVTDTIAPVVDVDVLPVLNGQCAVTVTVIPTATDECSGVLQGNTSDPLVYTQQGTYTITWVYTDAVGLTTTQTQQVVVRDTEAPVPSLVTLPVVEGQCGVTVTQFPTAVDACSGLLVGTTSDALTYSQQGTYTITWTYTDAVGLTAVQTQQIVVRDTEAPVPDVAVLPTVHGHCDVTVATVPTATDACSGVLVGTTTDALYYSGQGVYTITWTFIDAVGLVTTQTQEVRVEDRIAPVAIAYPNVTLALDGNGRAALTVADVNNGSTDNCSIATITLSKYFFQCSEVGTHTVVMTVTDRSGNASTASIVVEIAPIPAPTTPFTTQEFCAIEEARVRDLLLDDAVVVWYTSATGAQTVPVDALLVTGTYYAARVLGTCIGRDRLAVTVIIKDTPAPTADTPLLICKNEVTRLVDLPIYGDDVLWYQHASGGAPISGATIIMDGDVYYAAQLGTECESYERLEVPIASRYCAIIVYNAVSANGDGKNDYLLLEGIHEFPDNSVEVFNQWGISVFKTTRYGVLGNVFDGRATRGLGTNGQDLLPFGTYYYVITYVNHEGERVNVTGYLHLTH